VKSADSVAFGRAIGQLRRAKGIRRKEVVARLDGTYSDESAFGRIEQGRRAPDRDNALAIVVRGLGVTDLETINGLLALAGFDGVTQEDRERLKLETSDVLPPIRRSNQRQQEVKLWSWPATTAVAITSAILSGLAAVGIGQHIGIALIACGLYASLYAESLFLESAYLPNRGHLWPAATVVFSFMFVSSMSALAIDQVLVSRRNLLALPLSFCIFLLAAVIQWLVILPVLPEHTPLRARFQLLSGQAAHLKNTAYFLLLVNIFWLSPMHAVFVLEREQHAGRTQLIQDLLSRAIVIGQGAVALNVGPILVALALILLVSIPMGAHLMDNLKPHPKLNSFDILFFVRAVLYFALCFICLGWYFYSLGRLN
jgi:transcriptional regulator with XRE-family HTH domain